MLSAEAVSFWAGVPKPGVDPQEAKGWLRDGLAEVVAFAEEAGVVPCLEPEPGMLIETLDDFAALDIPGLKLALDTGHCLVTGEREPEAAVREFADRIGTVAIEDMKRGSHIHLPFGEGDMDVPGVLSALEEVGYGKLVCVELSRESHRADVMIPQALDFLRTCRRPGRSWPPGRRRGGSRSFSPPPCGEGPGVGVVPDGSRRCLLNHPHPYPSPQGGGITSGALRRMTA